MGDRIKKWELWGILVISVLGSILHFLFQWTDYWTPVGIIAAVNESVWEHLKIAFIPGFLFSTIEYFVFGRRVKSFFIGKFLGLLATPITIILLFYGYTLFSHHLLIVDIFIFVLAITFGQLISLYILKKKREVGSKINFFSIAGLMLLIISFSLLSFFPPRNFMFRDNRSGEYGILKEYRNKR